MQKNKTHPDCIRYKCEYRLPHYHCVIPRCGKRILVGDGDRRVSFHPCCSSGHIRIYNVIFFCCGCGSKLMEPGTDCLMCGVNNAKTEEPVIKVRPVTYISDFRERRAREAEKNSP